MPSGAAQKRGVKPNVAGTLPYGTNRVTVRLDPPLPPGLSLGLLHGARHPAAGSAMDPELTVSRFLLFAGDPVLHLSGLGLPGHGVILGDGCVQGLALSKVTGRRVVVGHGRGVDGHCIGGRISSRLTLLIGNVDLLIERKTIWHVGDAFNQGVVLVSMVAGPKGATRIRLAQIDGPGTGAQRQQAGQNEQPLHLIPP